MGAVGVVTLVDGAGVYVELGTVPGFQVGPLEAVETVGPLAVGDRIVALELGGDDFVIVGRLGTDAPLVLDGGGADLPD